MPSCCPKENFDFKFKPTTSIPWVSRDIKTQIIKFREEFYKISPEPLSKGINSLKEIEEKYPEYYIRRFIPSFARH